MPYAYIMESSASKVQVLHCTSSSMHGSVLVLDERRWNQRNIEQCRYESFPLCKLETRETPNRLLMSARTKHVGWLCASLLRKHGTSVLQTSSPLRIQLPGGSYRWDLANLFIRHGKRTGPLVLPTGTSCECCWADAASCYKQFTRASHISFFFLSLGMRAAKPRRVDV
jgi:hypothetical protein